VLGESLYYPQSHELPMEEFPSPFSLLFKVVVSTMPPKQDEMPGEAMLQLVGRSSWTQGGHPDPRHHPGPRGHGQRGCSPAQGRRQPNACHPTT